MSIVGERSLPLGNAFCLHLIIGGAVLGIEAVLEMRVQHEAAHPEAMLPLIFHLFLIVNFGCFNGFSEAEGRSREDILGLSIRALEFKVLKKIWVNPILGDLGCGWPPDQLILHGCKICVVRGSKDSWSAETATSDLVIDRGSLPSYRVGCGIHEILELLGFLYVVPVEFLDAAELSLEGGLEIGAHPGDLGQMTPIRLIIVQFHLFRDGQLGL